MSNAKFDHHLKKVAYRQVRFSLRNFELNSMLHYQHRSNLSYTARKCPLAQDPPSERSLACDRKSLAQLLGNPLGARSTTLTLRSNRRTRLRRLKVVAPGNGKPPPGENDVNKATRQPLKASRGAH